MTERIYRGVPDPEPDPVDPTRSHVDPAIKRREILMFLLLAVVIWPFVAVAVVGGYGFLVWMTQLIVGPPGPPAV